MLKIVVIQPGQPDQEVLVPGETATIGRVDPCDVVVDRPFVSKQHVRILHGTVAVDLGSSNGTFVGGRRMTEAVLLEGRTLALGQQGVELRVEVPSEALETASVADGELENLRSGYVLLEAEVATLKRELAQARDTGAQDALVGRLKGENASLRERLENLKAELEGREGEDSESVQARLAMQRVESVQELNERLQIEVERLKSELAERAETGAGPGTAVRPASGVQAPAADAGAELAGLKAERARLEAALAAEKAAARLHEDQTALVRKLRKELELVRAAGASPAPAPDLERALAESRAEASELRARAAELEGRLTEAAPAPGQNASDLFFKLRTENTELRKRLAVLEKGAPAAAAQMPGGKETRHVKELMEARMRIAALEAELAQKSTPQGTPRAVPIPAVRVAEAPVAAAAAGSCDVRALLRKLVESDVEGLPRASKGPVEEFVFVESMRLLRQVERVVTRVAGDLIQLFRLQTMLPETSGTYREIVSALLDERPGSGARDELAEYLEKLGRWLVASIGAHRKAAVLVVTRIKDDLTEKSLVARDPLPPYARVPMIAGNELWRRVQDYLATLSPDTIDERVEELAREQAQLLLNESG
jgi:pSer/pThr/pTyr-binding forkhead associated (FHA) protein